MASRQASPNPAESSHLGSLPPPLCRGREREVGVLEDGGAHPGSPSPRGGDGDCGLEFPVGQRGLKGLLSQLGINFVISPYPPSDHHLFPGLFCKNILLKDRKQQFYLVVMLEEKTLDLKKLKKDVGAHRNFSFATAKELWDLLGVQSGGVTPFGLINDKERTLRVVLDTDLNTEEKLNFHPLNPEHTYLCRYSELETFLTHLGYKIETLNV